MTYLLRDVRDHLQASVEIANAFEGRIYPDVAPQGTKYPFINLSDLSNDPAMSLAGEVGTHETVITVDVWTDGVGGREEANRLGELIRNRMNGHRGQLGNGVFCNGCEMLRNNTVASDPLPNSDQHRRRVSQDYQIFHSAEVPTFT